MTASFSLVMPDLRAVSDEDLESLLPQADGAWSRQTKALMLSLGAQKLNLGFQDLGIGAHRIIGLGALGAAGAKPAQAAAEWDMYIQRNLCIGGNTVEPTCEIGRSYRAAKLRCRWVAGIAGHARVKETELHQLRLDCHARSLAARAIGCLDPDQSSRTHQPKGRICRITTPKSPI